MMWRKSSAMRRTVRLLMMSVSVMVLFGVVAVGAFASEVAGQGDGTQADGYVSVVYMPGYEGDVQAHEAEPCAVGGDVFVAKLMFERENFAFAGWMFEGKNYAPGETVRNVQGDVQLVAQWEAILDAAAGLQTPLAPAPTAQTWSLVNLVVGVLCAGVSVAMIANGVVSAKKAKLSRMHTDGHMRTKSMSVIWRTLGIAVGFVGAATFLVVEDFGRIMTITSRATIPMCMVLLVQILMVLFMVQAQRTEQQAQQAKSGKRVFRTTPYSR